VEVEDLARRCACGWREGVEVDFCARRAEDIQKTCSIITAESGIAKGYICDLARPESVSQFSSQLLTSDKPIDILILNAAQWLSGRLDDQPDTEIINTVSSGLTGSILLTQALLPGLRRSDSADIISIISSCGVPNFTDSIAHPAFSPANTVSAGLQLNCHSSCPKKISVLPGCIRRISNLQVRDVCRWSIQDGGTSNEWTIGLGNDSFRADSTAQLPYQ
jgi:NADP-dependent 3-hydroxy acid dehydrogenase YdfG